MITKETTRFKEPTTPGCQLALTLYLGDLFGVAASLLTRFVSKSPVLLLNDLMTDLSFFQGVKKNEGIRDPASTSIT